MLFAYNLKSSLLSDANTPGQIKHLSFYNYEAYYSKLQISPRVNGFTNIPELCKMSLLNKILFSVFISFYAICSTAADAITPVLQGHWSGVWYIGMSSGKSQLTFNDNGTASISFTNLDEFGEDEIAVNKLTVDASAISFSVPSKYSAFFQIQLKIKPDGLMLDGSGKFDGAGAKLVFTKSN